MKITIDIDEDEALFVRGGGLRRADTATGLMGKIANAMVQAEPVRAGDRVRDADGDEGRALFVARGHAWVIFDDLHFHDDLVPLDKLVRA